MQRSFMHPKSFGLTPPSERSGAYTYIHRSGSKPTISFSSIDRELAYLGLAIAGREGVYFPSQRFNKRPDDIPNDTLPGHDARCGLA